EKPDDTDARFKACHSNNIDTVRLCRMIFDSTKEKANRQMAANQMIRRGFREEIFISYLFDLAKQALVEDVPPMHLYRADGTGVKDAFNPEFDAWSGARGLTRQQGIFLVNER